MELNSIIFPSPKPSYTSDSKNLIWITGEEPKLKGDKTFTRKFQQYKVKARIISRSDDQSLNANKENDSNAINI